MQHLAVRAFEVSIRSSSVQVAAHRCIAFSAGRLKSTSREHLPLKALNRETRLDRQPLVAPHPLQLTPAQEWFVVELQEPTEQEQISILCWTQSFMAPQWQ